MHGFLTFLRDDRGAETIQFLVWLPLIFSMLVIVTDVSLLYLSHTEMVNVARDTARRMTTGQLGSREAAIAHAAAELAQYNYPFTVDASYAPEESMQVVISVAVNDVSTFGFFINKFIGKTVNTKVVMRAEPT